MTKIWTPGAPAIIGVKPKSLLLPGRDLKAGDLAAWSSAGRPSMRKQAGFLRIRPGVGRWGRDRYSVEAVDADGSSYAQWGVVGAGANGSNSSNLTVSIWVYLDSLPTWGTWFCVADSFSDGYSYSRLLIGNGVSSGIASRCVLSCTDGFSSDTLNITSNTGGLSTGSWIHVVCSSNGSTRQMYINGSSNVASSSGSTVEWSAQRHGRFFALTDSLAATKMNGGMAEFYVAKEFIDLSSAANRAKFRTQSGDPEWLGDHGERPTGNVPIYYFSALRGRGRPSTDFFTNKGSGPSFTSLSGTHTYRADSPSY